MTLQEDTKRKELVILDLLTKRTLTPADISSWALMNIEDVAIITSSLLRKGLILQMSDGFSTFFYITDRGNEVLKSRAGTFGNQGSSDPKD